MLKGQSLCKRIMVKVKVVMTLLDCMFSVVQCAEHVLVWQQPYVNVFKHFNVQSWKKCSKEGEVTALMVTKIFYFHVFMYLIIPSSVKGFLATDVHVVC